MSSFYIKKKWINPPTFDVDLDLSSPQAVSLVGSWPVHSGSLNVAARDKSAPTQIEPVILGDISNRVAGFGYSLLGGNTASSCFFWDQLDGDFARLQTGSYSFRFIVSPDFAANDYHFIIDIDSRLVLSFGNSDSTLLPRELGVTWYDGAFQDLTTSITTWVVGEEHNLTFTVEEGVSQNLYLDGELVDSSSLTSSIVYSSAGRGVSLMGRGWVDVSNVEPDVYVKDFRIYNKALSPDEVREIYKNPYQILKPRIQFIPVPAVISTIITIAKGNINWLGQNLNVTATVIRTILKGNLNWLGQNLNSKADIVNLITIGNLNWLGQNLSTTTIAVRSISKGNLNWLGQNLQPIQNIIIKLISATWNWLGRNIIIPSIGVSTLAFNDAKLDKLETALAKTGHINDLEVEWLQSLDAAVTSGDLDTAWQQYWDSQLVAAGSRNDRAYAWLGGLGYTGTLSKRWYDFWLAP